MTDVQQKVLAFIRQRREVEVADLPGYYYRSVDPLVRDGWLRLIPCGICHCCKLNQLPDNRMPYNCNRPKVKAVVVRR